MAFDFPSSPTQGQLYKPAGQPIYQYSNGQWRRPTGSALPYNYVINPNMQVSQQNGNAASAATGNFFAADCWRNGYTLATSGVVTTQRVEKRTPRGSLHRIRQTVTTAKASLAATDYVFLQTCMEGYRIANLGWPSNEASAIPIRCPAVLRLGLCAPAGTWTVGVGTADLPCIVFEITVPAGLANTDVEYVFPVPVPPTGAAFFTDNRAGIYVTFCFATGATYKGAPNVWNNTSWIIGTSASTNGMATVGNTFELFDVGFYADPQNTGLAPEFQSPLYDDDLHDCLRYWYKSTFGRGVSHTTGSVYVYNTHFVPMRANPTVSLVGSGLRIYTSQASPNIASIAGNYSTPDFLGLLLNTSSAVLPGYSTNILSDAQNTNYIAVDARL